MINLVALSCRTFGLVHVLIDHSFGAAIPIAHGDPDGDDEDIRSDGVHSAVKSGGYYSAKTIPLIKILALSVLQQTLLSEKLLQ